MGIITISRMYGAGGTTLAKKLSECMNYKYVDQEYLHNFCNKAKDNFCLITSEDEESPSFGERFSELMTNKSFYRIALYASIYKLALEDNVIFVGRGGHLILEGFPNVISLQVIRTLSERVKAIAEIKNISYDKALELVEKKDEEKAEFFNYYFDASFIDPLKFHIILNSSLVPINSAIDMLCSFSKGFFNNEKRDKAKVILEKRLIEKNAELLLFKYDLVQSFGKITFEMKDDGVMKINGVIAGSEEKEKLIKAVKGLPGVKNVEDHLKISVLTHIVY